VDFYEFVGILIPGSAILVSFKYLMNLQELNNLFAPQSLGGLGIHLMLAYVVGHLLQALGNGLETVYWGRQRGMPTDWPASRPNDLSQDAVSAVLKLCNHRDIEAKQITIAQWRGLISQARSTVYASNRSERLHIFNGNYGMFRGLLAAEIIVGIAAIWTQVNHWLFYAVLLLIMFLTIYRMHRFAILYANELFANVKELLRVGKRESNGKV
jgi:hypothetical protein